MASATDKYKYERKTDRGKWRAGDMTSAINKVSCKGLTLRRDAEIYNVPKRTLACRVLNKNK